MKLLYICILAVSLNLHCMHVRVTSPHVTKARQKSFCTMGKRTLAERNVSHLSTSNVARKDIQWSNVRNKSLNNNLVPAESRYSLLKKNMSVTNPINAKRTFWGLVAASSLLGDDEDERVSSNRTASAEGYVCDCCKKWKVRQSELTENYEKHNTRLDSEIETLTKENWRLNLILKSVKENRDEKIFLVNTLQAELEELRTKIECNKKNEDDINSSDKNKSNPKLRYSSCELDRFIGV